MGENEKKCKKEVNKIEKNYNFEKCEKVFTYKRNFG